jgi:alpha-N-arabinofuranosidase
MAAHLTLSHLQHMQTHTPDPHSKTYAHIDEFTRMPVTLDTRVRADASAPPIPRELYGGFLEHLGRCIYGGIVDDAKNPSPADLIVAQGDGKAGWRKDVQAILAADGELAVPLMRWPGGNFVSNYHWQDGIGPVEGRPKRIELAWRTTESNQ